MSLFLQSNEVCPYKDKCPYNYQNSCMGGNPERNNTFTCELVSNNGVFKENESVRSHLDETGKMELILE